MLKVHRRGIDPSDVADSAQDAIWVDLLNPTSDEERSVESLLGIEIAEEASLSESEASSRRISEHGKLYLSSPAVRVDEHGDAYLTPIGFVIGAEALVTVRFAALPIFETVADRVRADDTLESGMCVFTALLEAMVDRGADVLEHLGAT